MTNCEADYKNIESTARELICLYALLRDTYIFKKKALKQDIRVLVNCSMERTVKTNSLPPTGV